MISEEDIEKIEKDLDEHEKRIEKLERLHSKELDKRYTAFEGLGITFNDKGEMQITVKNLGKVLLWYLGSCLKVAETIDEEKAEEMITEIIKDEARKKGGDNEE